VSFTGSIGFSHSRRRSAGPGAVGCVWRSRATSSGRRIPALGLSAWSQPRVCFSILKVCSMSNLRRNACQARSTPAGAGSVFDQHSHAGFGSPPRGRRSTSSRMTVPSMTGSLPTLGDHPKPAARSAHRTTPLDHVVGAARGRAVHRVSHLESQYLPRSSIHSRGTAPITSPGAAP
jgi:hypothetical protein